MNFNNKTILETANAAVMNGDYESFLSFCTDDTEWVFVGERILKGKDAVREYMRKVYLEPPQFTVAHFISEGDFVTAIGEISLKDEQGKKTNYSYCDVWRFSDGKMAGLQAFVIANEAG